VGVGEAQRAGGRIGGHGLRLQALVRYLMIEVADEVELFRRGAEECVKVAEASLEAGDCDGCVDSLYRLLRKADRVRDRIREAIDEVVNEVRSACAEGGRAGQGGPSPPA